MFHPPTKALDVLFIRVPPWLFVEHPHPENCDWPIDLGIAMALVERDGHRVHFCDLETRRQTLDDACRLIRELRAGVVVINGITPSHSAMLHLAGVARHSCPRALIMACGQHATSVPESFLFDGSPFDLCAIGEFEVTVREAVLAAARGWDPWVDGTAVLGGGSVRIAAERPPTKDLDSLPFPLHRFFADETYGYYYPMAVRGRHRWGFILATRGCPYPCIYCSRTLRTSFGSEIRTRSPQNVVNEIRLLVSAGVNVLVFEDDTINIDRDYLQRLCRCIIESGVSITWAAEGRVDLADEETLRLMKQAGCCTIGFGVESGSPRILDLLDKRSAVEDVEAAFAAARRVGLMTVAFFLIGCPGETEEDLEMTVALMKRIRPTMIQVAFFTPYPGSPCYREMRERLPARWDDYSHYNRIFNSSKLSDERLRAYQARLYRELLFSPWFIPEYLARCNTGLLANFGRQWRLVRYGLKFLLHGPRPVP